MNRIIKFRAWDFKSKQMFKVDEIRMHGNSYTVSILGFSDKQWLTPERNAVMQFTGLLDKNGKEIYEGDRVRILYTDWCSKNYAKEELQKLSLEDYKKAISDNGIVLWKGDKWQIEFDGRFGKEYGSIFPGTHGEIEVIGNIFENPELLEEFKKVL